MTRSFISVTCRYAYFVIAGYTEGGPVELCTTGEATLMRRSAADALWECQQMAERVATDKMDARLAVRKAQGLSSSICNETWLREFSWYDTQAPSKVARSFEQGLNDGWTARRPWREGEFKPRLWGKSKAARKQAARDDAAWALKEAQWDAEDAAHSCLTGMLLAATEVAWEA